MARRWTDVDYWPDFVVIENELGYACIESVDYD